MRWLVGGNVFDVEKGSFRRADIGIEGERITVITPQAKPDRKDESMKCRAPGCCRA